MKEGRPNWRLGEIRHLGELLEQVIHALETLPKSHRKQRRMAKKWKSTLEARLYQLKKEVGEIP